MVQKVIDIIPPAEKEVLPVKLTVNIEKKPQIVKTKPEIKKPFPKNRLILILVFLLLITAGVGCYFTLAEANISIWPNTEVQTFNIKATVDKSAKEVSISGNLIPGTILEKETGSILFWLDAHFPGADFQLAEYDAEIPELVRLPVTRELHSILCRPPASCKKSASVIIIDDLQLIED